MKIYILKWLGHMERMDDNKQTKNVCTKKKQRLRDSVKKDELEMTNWRENIRDRAQWR
jgi:hypothetical protein